VRLGKPAKREGGIAFVFRVPSRVSSVGCDGTLPGGHVVEAGIEFHTFREVVRGVALGEVAHGAKWQAL
jgi:hypothetical protein